MRNRDTIPQNILLATDLGSRSDRALDRAAQLAGEWGAQLHVVHALGQSATAAFPASTRSDSNDPREQAERRLRNDLGPLVETLQPQIHIEQGNPGPAIIDMARSNECSLIVAGVARHEAVGRKLLGDTVDFLARKATVPVLIVRERATGPYEEILAATDFSPASAEAVKTVRALFPRSRLALLHAYQIPFSGVLMNDKIQAEFQELGERATAEFLQTNDLPQDLPRIVEQGTPEQVIAEHDKADRSLLVIGSHGASALATMVLGSTARSILNRTEGDILLVPFTKREGG